MAETGILVRRSHGSPAMFRYLASYRLYTLAKIGFAAAYLWFVADFLRIHLAIWQDPLPLLPPASDLVFLGVADLEPILRNTAEWVNAKPAVWALAAFSPMLAGLYLWGRRRWLQVAVGCGMSFTMIALTSLSGVFNSTADVWLNYVFLAYALAAAVCPADAWERREPGFSLAKWREDPLLASSYASLIVILEFTVYFFAGINKLVYGWEPWTTGTALQNLAIDSSMRDYLRGIHVPYVVSVALCYVTLAQRLIVPFGFFSRRYRLWSALILGAMHLGYFLLMQVAIFPLIGIASLLIVAPPRGVAAPLFGRVPSGHPKPVKKLLSLEGAGVRYAGVAMGFFSVWLLLESARLAAGSAMAWENKLMVVPAWRMFADGGATSGNHWRIILQTPQGEVDATDLSRELLPHLWRDRFYVDLVMHLLLSAEEQGGRGEPDPLLRRLFAATERAYTDRQLQAHGDPTIYRARFAIERRPH